MKYYECVMCESINSNARFCCATCGTVPAKYSFIHKPISFRQDDGGVHEVVKARGFQHAYPSHAKVGLRTVRADYYAE